MGRSDWYKSGSWNAICEVCGRKVKATSLKKRWDGVMVCSRDWEPRHPQDFVRGVKDNPSVPISRPEAPDTFVPWNYTQFPSDTITIDEALAKNFTKNINPHTVFDVGINDAPLNTYVLNYEALYSPTIEDISITESVSLSVNKIFSESITITESVTFIITSGAVLNGQPINGTSLG